MVRYTIDTEPVQCICTVYIYIYTVQYITVGITVGQYGQTTLSKDFLQPGERSIAVQRGPKSKRCRCDTLYTESICAETWDKLLQRECATYIL